MDPTMTTELPHGSYVLIGQGAWFAIDKFVVYVCRTKHGLLVEIFSDKVNEDGEFDKHRLNVMHVTRDGEQLEPV